MFAAWLGGDCSMNIVAHYASSHMPASMIDSCSLSWTKWKVPAFEPDKEVVCLPDLNWCAHFCSAGRAFLFPLQGVFVANAHSGLQRKFPCDLLREYELVSHGLGHYCTCTYACAYKCISCNFIHCYQYHFGTFASEVASMLHFRISDPRSKSHKS